MEIPTCVIDAKTFVDNIHEIKSWIYRGHLHLILPTDSFEGVQRLSEKSIESKATPQEQSRPKSAGKTARKEYPAFDINPKIALEYLSRIQKGKNGESCIKDRPLYEMEESQDSLEFQQPSQEYGPWKDIPVTEEKPEPPDTRPTSWAEAARKKSNLLQGSGEKIQGTKGPAKPKLVSKTPSNESSPWKIQRNAPKVSPVEVPGPLRPLMSYTLWRMHESVHRNDTNQTFLLTDDYKTRSTAAKLNIIVRSVKDLSLIIKASVPEIDRSVFGDLERDGLAESRKKADPENKMQGGNLIKNSATNEDGLKDESDENARPGDKVYAPESIPNGHINGTAAHKTDGASPAPDTTDGNIGDAQRKDGDLTATKEEERNSPVNTKPSAAPINPQDLVKSILNPVAPFQQTPTDRIQEQEVVQEPIRDGIPTPPILESQIERKTGQEDVSAKSSNEGQTISHADNEEILEDSDEEVVVFVPNPKRMSAQKKAAQSNSRPSTSGGPSQPIIEQKALLPPNMTGQHELRPAFQPSKQKKSIGKSNSRPNSSGPTIIDPDAFGRGFAVNPDSSPRANHGRPRSRHSPQPSMQQSHPHSTLNGNAATFQPRTSPQSQTAARSPRRGPRAPLPAADEAQPSHAPTVPVISHQAYTRAPPILPNGQNSKESKFGPIGPPKKPVKEQAVQVAKDADFDRTLPQESVLPAPVPRPKDISGANLQAGSQKARRPSPHSTPVNGFGDSATQGKKQRPTKPSLFEPMLDDTRAPPPPPVAQPESRGQDVQYVLKSGMTREASRGKGKLWIG